MSKVLQQAAGAEIVADVRGTGPIKQ